MSIWPAANAVKVRGRWCRARARSMSSSAARPVRVRAAAISSLAPSAAVESRNPAARASACRRAASSATAASSPAWAWEACLRQPRIIPVSSSSVSRERFDGGQDAGLDVSPGGRSCGRPVGHGTGQLIRWGGVFRLGGLRGAGRVIHVGGVFPGQGYAGAGEAASFRRRGSWPGPGRGAADRGRRPGRTGPAWLGRPQVLSRDSSSGELPRGSGQPHALPERILAGYLAARYVPSRIASGYGRVKSSEGRIHRRSPP